MLSFVHESFFFDEFLFMILAVMKRWLSFLMWRFFDDNCSSAIVLAAQFSSIFGKDVLDLNDFFLSSFNWSMSGIVELITRKFRLVNMLI